MLTIENKDKTEGEPFQMVMNLELNSLDEAMNIIHKISETKHDNTYSHYKTINPQENDLVLREKLWKPVWDSNNTYPC